MSSVRQQISIAATPRKVWSHLTTLEGMLDWLVEGGRLEARAGGRVILEIDKDGESTFEAAGTFHTLRPTRKIEIAFDRAGQGDWLGSHLQILVARDGEETRVSIVHRGTEGVFAEEESCDGLESFWKHALRALRGSLER